jgi:hypothetical protein
LAVVDFLAVVVFLAVDFRLVDLVVFLACAIMKMN